MKKSGSICVFNTEREDAIMRAYRQEAARSSTVNIDEIACRIVMSQSPRFWVSEERASIVVSAMMRDVRVIERMLPTKRRMFTEIFSRVTALRRKRPCATMVSLVSEVIYSPAPEFYMQPRYVRDIIYTAQS